MSDKVTSIIEEIKGLSLLEASQLVKGLEAVSYTHLTLPTICSV